MPHTLVAQLTDCHVVATGGTLFGWVDPNARLAAAVAYLNRLNPRPDVVVLSGDLVDGGRVEEYHALRAILGDLAIPFLLLPGNHDDRDNMRAVFPEHDYLPREGFLNWSVEVQGMRLVGLDTQLTGQPIGQVCHERADWLARTLAAHSCQPTLLFMHHPPFLTGVEMLDVMGCTGTDRLAMALADQRHVEAILCGHHHVSMVTHWNHVLAMVAPATSYRIAAEEMPPRWVLEPPACMLHTWRRGAGLISRVALVEAYASDPLGKALPIRVDAACVDVAHDEVLPSGGLDMLLGA
ncbi:MAG TPA: phosphodiesterase [Stellaceae bacterium]|nr:phosphodiesterase [Stellaceae bacterium]